MMATSCESDSPLKCKLGHLKGLLDNVSKRLNDDYQVFATKSSAINTAKLQNGGKEVPKDIIKVTSDIGTLKSVLMCPIFDQIVNVTDSLNKLSYYLNTRPSLSPNDIDIDPNSGELILAPPINPETILMNANTSESSSQDKNSVTLANINDAQENLNENYSNLPQQPINSNINGQNYDSYSRQIPLTVDESIMMAQEQYRQQQNIIKPAQQPIKKQQQQQKQLQDYSESRMIMTSFKSHDTEKLVNNGTNININQVVESIPNRNIQSEGRLYKANGNMTLNKSQTAYNMVTNESLGSNEAGPASMEPEFDQQKYTQECKSYVSVGSVANNQIRPHVGIGNRDSLSSDTNGNGSLSSDSSKQNARAYVSKLQIGAPTSEKSAIVSSQGQGELQKYQQQFGRGSSSPSTSLGSTVRLADVCDSGPSSYMSQGIKIGNAPRNDSVQGKYISQGIQSASSSIEAAKNFEEVPFQSPPEMESIKVTLTKDSKNSLGITIAGYTCEDENISGIFIKRVMSDSPAARSNKIQALDQIFAVNGRQLLDYNNRQAVEVLKQTGQVVTLELMRFEDETKLNRLQSMIEKAINK